MSTFQLLLVDTSCLIPSGSLSSVCHLMNGHTEHRSGKWDQQELYRSIMQALEGRCSTRSNLAKEFEMQIREFTATVRVTRILFTQNLLNFCRVE